MNFHTKNNTFCPPHWRLIIFLFTCLPCVSAATPPIYMPNSFQRNPAVVPTVIMQNEPNTKPIQTQSNPNFIADQTPNPSPQTPAAQGFSMASKCPIDYYYYDYAIQNQFSKYSNKHKFCSNKMYYKMNDLSDTGRRRFYRKLIKKIRQYISVGLMN